MLDLLGSPLHRFLLVCRKNEDSRAESPNFRLTCGPLGLLETCRSSPNLLSLLVLWMIEGNRPGLAPALLLSSIEPMECWEALFSEETCDYVRTATESCRTLPV